MLSRLASTRRIALAGLLAGACILSPLAAEAAPTASITLTPISTHATGMWDESASEIPAYDPITARIFVVNAAAGTVDVLDARDPHNLTHLATLESPGANSVAVGNGIVAVAEQAAVKTDPGTVSFFDVRSLKKVATVTVGALPDNITFTPQGTFAVVANEGEPTGYGEGDVDPEGSVSIIDLRRGAHRATVRTAGFEAFDADELRARGVRLTGPGATVAQDLEPEFAAIDRTGRTAYVTLQENNAIAIVDILGAKVTDIVPLGLKDHALPGQGLDASDRDGRINIANWPVKGLAMPDGIATFWVPQGTFTITANEGDAREWGDYLDEARVKDLTLDPVAFPNAKALQANGALGRLNVVTDSPRGPNGYTELWSYGARSITIRDAAGALVWDSGDALERMMAEFDPASFNGEGNEDGTFSFDDRSDNKGPEPEGVAVGQVRNRTYAFVGLERASAIAVFDVTNPHQPTEVGVFRNPGDVAPEGLTFVPHHLSRTRTPLLIVGNEVSGTTTVWEITS